MKADDSIMDYINIFNGTSYNEAHPADFLQH